MTIEVEFDSDDLTTPQSKLVERNGFGSYSIEPEYDCVVENVKVKKINMCFFIPFE